MRVGAGQHSHGRGSSPVQGAWVSMAFLTVPSVHPSTAPIGLWRTFFLCRPRYPSR